MCVIQCDVCLYLNVRLIDNLYSGAPLMWTPLGPSTSGRIIMVSSFQGLLIRGGYVLFFRLTIITDDVM